MEKIVKSQKYILVLKCNRTQSSNQQVIEAETKRFYENLFENKDAYLTIENIDDFWDSQEPNLKKISEGQKVSLELDLTLKELSEALKETNNGLKSPK